MQEWKAIKGFEGGYEISNDGQVKSLARITKGGNNGPFAIKERLLRITFTKLRPNVSMSYQGTKRTFLVHKLVADAFLPQPEGKDVVIHKDGNLKNCCVDNLEWLSNAELAEKRKSDDTYKALKGTQVHSAKLSEENVLSIRDRYSRGNETMFDLAAEFNVSKALISYIVNYKSWKHI